MALSLIVCGSKFGGGAQWWRELLNESPSSHWNKHCDPIPGHVNYYYMVAVVGCCCLLAAAAAAAHCDGSAYSTTTADRVHPTTPPVIIRV